MHLAFWFFAFLSNRLQIYTFIQICFMLFVDLFAHSLAEVKIMQAVNLWVYSLYSQMASSTDAHVEMLYRICLCSSSLRQEADKKWGKKRKKTHICVVEKLPQPTPCCIQLLSWFHTDEEESCEEKYGGEEFGFCMRDLYSPALRTDVWRLSTARFDNKVVLIWLQIEATCLS